jgi:hypothetical protein
MQFADPQQRANAYLILRHLYDGDVIEWPIDPGHSLKHLFDALELQGFIARWDRMWPLHDRYRLTEAGIAAIEAVYRPGGADVVWNDLRGRNLTVIQRRTYLIDHGYDPFLWVILHDSSTYWDTYYDDPGIYYGYVYEDAMPYQHRGFIDDGPVIMDSGPGYIDGGPSQPAYNVDLDREAAGPGADLSSAAAPDYDVS